MKRINNGLNCKNRDFDSRPVHDTYMMEQNSVTEFTAFKQTGYAAVKTSKLLLQ